MTLRFISTLAAPRPVGPYSQAVAAGGFLYTAGMVGVDPATGKLADGLAAQAERAFENVRALLTAEALTTADLVKVTIFLTDIGRFGEVNTIYEKFLGASRPARSTVGVAALPLGALIEVDAVAKVSAP